MQKNCCPKYVSWYYILGHPLSPTVWYFKELGVWFCDERITNCYAKMMRGLSQNPRHMKLFSGLDVMADLTNWQLSHKQRSTGSTLRWCADTLSWYIYPQLPSPSNKCSYTSLRVESHVYFCSRFWGFVSVLDFVLFQPPFCAMLHTKLNGGISTLAYQDVGSGSCILKIMNLDHAHHQ